jgi:hypothetical protein
MKKPGRRILFGRHLPQHKAQVHLVDQGLRLQGLPGLFAAQPLHRQSVQLIADQGQRLLGGVPVALLDALKPPPAPGDKRPGSQNRSTTPSFPAPIEVKIPFRDPCYDCHRQKGAEDNVFAQFYPVLKAARGGDTLREKP